MVWDIELSPEGEAKRRAMRGQLQQRLAADRVRRRRVRGVAAAVLIVMAAGLIRYSDWQSRQVAGPETAIHSGPVNSGVEHAASTDSIAGPSPGAGQLAASATMPAMEPAENGASDGRSSAEPPSDPGLPREYQLSHITVRIIDDSEAVRLLEKAGDPYFIVRSQGRVLVVPGRQPEKVPKL